MDDESWWLPKLNEERCKKLYMSLLVIRCLLRLMVGR